MEVTLCLQNSGLVNTSQSNTWVAYDFSSIAGSYVQVTCASAFKACPDDQGLTFTPNAGGAGQVALTADTPTPASGSGPYTLTHMVSPAAPFLWVALDAAGPADLRINVTSRPQGDSFL